MAWIRRRCAASPDTKPPSCRQGRLTVVIRVRSAPELFKAGIMGSVLAAGVGWLGRWQRPAPAPVNLRLPELTCPMPRWVACSPASTAVGGNRTFESARCLVSVLTGKADKRDQAQTAIGGLRCRYGTPLGALPCRLSRGVVLFYAERRMGGSELYPAERPPSDTSEVCSATSALPLIGAVSGRRQTAFGQRQA